MPNLWRKKNKSYGVSSKEGPGSVSAVRPLSAAFGTTDLGHLDEDEAASKKHNAAFGTTDLGHLDEDEAASKKHKVRGASKSTKTSSNTRSRSTSVPARPKSASFGSHLLPHGHIAEGKTPKRSESPVAYGKPRQRPDQDPFLQIDKQEEHEGGKAEGRNGRKVSNSGSFGGSGKLTVIRYTDKSMTQAGDLWKSPASQDKEDTGFDPYQTIYQALNPIQDRADSIESLPENPFPREPSIRVPTNTYHAKKSFSTFAAEETSNGGSSPGEQFNGQLNGSTFSQGKEHIYDEPANVLISERTSTQKSHVYEQPAKSQTLDNRKVPPPPRRSTSLQFEDVAIPTEQYRPLSSFIAPVQRKESASDQFETAKIVHITHESTKSPAVGEYDSLTSPVANIYQSIKPKVNEELKQEFSNDSNSSVSGSDGKDTDSSFSGSSKGTTSSNANQYSDPVLRRSAIPVNVLESDMSDTSSSHMQYELSDMDMLSLKSDRTPRYGSVNEQIQESIIHHRKEQTSKSLAKSPNIVHNFGRRDDHQETETSSESSLNNTDSFETSEAQERKEVYLEEGVKENPSDVLSSHTPVSLEENVSLEIKTQNPGDLRKMGQEEENQVQNTKDQGNIGKENLNTQSDIGNDTQQTLQGIAEVDHEPVSNSILQGSIDLTKSIDKASVTDVNIDMDGSVNNELEARLTNTLAEKDKENVPPMSDHKGMHVAAVIHSFNNIKDSNKEGKHVKTDITKQNGDDIDPVPKDLSTSEKVSDIIEKDTHAGAVSVVNSENYTVVSSKEKLVKEHDTQEENKAAIIKTKALTSLSVTKPVVPYKPKKLSEKINDKQSPSTSSASGASSGNQRTVTGLLAPKPFLLKPQKFVPSKRLTGNSSESASDKETSDSSNSSVSAISPVIKPFKSVPFSSMLGLKTEHNLSRTAKDNVPNISSQKPTLAVKPQFLTKTTDLPECKESTALQKQQLLDTNTKISGTITSTSYASESVIDVERESAKPAISKPVPATRSSVSYLDSLKHKHSVKRETGPRSLVVVKDIPTKETELSKTNDAEKDSGITSVKYNSNVETENRVDVSSFLDGLKAGKKKGNLHSPPPVSSDVKPVDINPEDTVNSSPPLPQNNTKKPIASLVIEPIALDETRDEPKQKVLNHSEDGSGSKPENKTLSGISIKEMLINDICDLPETSVDTDPELDEGPEGDAEETQNSGTFLGLKNIDTMSQKEHVLTGVLSPRQLKRSRGKFSRGSFIDQKPVDAVQRRRRLSSSSCSEKESISDSNPNEDISKASYNMSIQSENSAFHLVKSDEEADTSLDMIDDIPTESQVDENNLTQSTDNDVIRFPNDSLDIHDLGYLSTKVPVVLHRETDGNDLSSKDTGAKPTPPPRRNRERKSQNKIAQRSSFSNSDKSSSKQSSAPSTESSTNRELAAIEQSQKARFMSLADEGDLEVVGEQGVCMPWDNALWDGILDEDSFVIAPSEFRSEDVVPPPDLGSQSNGIVNINDEEIVSAHQLKVMDKDKFDDIPSPQMIPSPVVPDSETEVDDNLSSNSGTNVDQKQDSNFVLPTLNLEALEDLHSENNTDLHDGMQDTLAIPKLNLSDINGVEEPPSPFEANEAVSKIFDETVRQSARYTSTNDVGISPRSVSSSQHNSDREVHSELPPEVTPVNGYFTQEAGKEKNILEQNDHFRFERNMKGLRSPISAKRKQELAVHSDNSSTSSKYSERAIDIQDLDTNGKPMAINKRYEERGVDIEGLERSSIIRSPLTPAQRRKRKENRLSDSGSSQLSKQMSSKPVHQPGAHQDVPALNLKDNTDSEASSYTQPQTRPRSTKSDPNVFVYDDTEDKSMKSDTASPRESLSPTTPSSVCVSEISDIKPNPRDLASISLPGLKLSQEVSSGPLRGSEHLHPALERSLRTNLIPQRVGMTGGGGGGGTQSPASEARIPAIGSELMILVEEDYMTPRPGYNHALMQNSEIPEAWTFDMVHNVRPAGADNGLLLQRQASVASRASSTTTITNTRWQTRPVELWGNEDLMDWAEATGYEELADALHGTGIGGNQFLQFQETTLVELGLISADLRGNIMEEVNRFKEQPKSSVPLWTLKQASVRRKNLEASSNALKSRLTNLQQLNSKQEEQIQSYLQELKDHQKQTDLLINSPPPSIDGLSDSTLDHDPGRHKLARLNSVSTEVSAFLPPLSLSESEASTYNDVPVHPLVEWDNSEVLRWLTSSGLYTFSNLFFTHKVTGRDLSEISMQFLDKIGIEKLEERELLLSKLYELQHPGEPSLEEVLKAQSDASTSQSQTESLLKTTGSSAKSTGSNGSSSVSLKRDRKRSSVVMGTRMVSKDLKRESPWTPASNRKSRDLSTEEKESTENNVMIWHQLGGTMTSSYIRVKEGTSCYDVIQNLLQIQHVTDDSNLFYVVDRNFSGHEVEVSKTEDMSALQREWDNPVGHKLELRQRSGVQIKVFHKTAEGRQKTKSFRIATSSSYSEVLLVSCRKFRVKRAADCMLLDLNRHTGAVSQIAAGRTISEMLTDCFILCERTAFTEAAEMAAMLKRRGSTGSQNSSDLSDTASQVTITSSHMEQVDRLHAEIVEFDSSVIVESEDEEDDLEANHSQQVYPNTHTYNRFHSKSSHNITQDDFAKSPNITQRKPLHRNFRSMDEMDFKNFYDGFEENDIPQRRVFSANDELDRVHQNAPDSLELLQELALLKESLRERDVSLMDLRTENKQLTAKTHDAMFTQNRLKSLETMYAEKQEAWKTEVSSLQLQLQHLQQQQLEADPQAKVRHLEEKVEESRAEVWRQEEEVMVVREELEKQAADNRPDPGLVEYLQTQLNHSEGLLLGLKQEHGDLLLHLDHTRKKLLKKQQQTTVDLFALIGSDKPLCLHALELEPKNGSYGLMIGRDNEKRLMVRHTEEGRPIIKGDRLIEVNGRLVAKLEDDEIANFLKNAKEKNGPLQIVVLREQEPIKGQVTNEEFEQMKDDYSLAMMEVESLQQENKDLTGEVAMLTKDFEAAAKERDDLQKKMDQLKSQFGNLPLTETDFVEASPHKRLQLMLDTINAGKPHNQALTASQLRRGASRRGLDWFNTLVSVDRLDQVLAYDELDEKLPLYESMKIAPKEDVLQALKDTILETKQQKAYLDKLMALVIDHSPYLLKYVDASMGMEDDLMSIKSRTEEKC